MIPAQLPPCAPVFAALPRGRPRAAHRLKYFLPRCLSGGRGALRRHPGAIQGRYAGNQLAILLPGLSKQETLTAAEQLLNQLQRLSWPEYVNTEQALYLGAVCYQPGEAIEQVEEEAEQALRHARQHRLVIAPLDAHQG